MEQIPVSQLVPGLIIQLSEKQKLWDVTKNPWRELAPPAQLRVLKLTRMASGATGGRVPYDLLLQALDGTTIGLEVLDGDEVVCIVRPP